MAINIKVYKTENLDNFTRLFGNETKLETGSLNAMTAAMAASVFQRCAKLAPESERQAYLLKNSEILRSYFIHLIDDDCKARSGYNKEIKDGDAMRIDASIHPAVTINEEVINMCNQMLELGLELKNMLDVEYHHYLKEMAELSLGAIKSSISWILNLTSKSVDETYKFVVKRENEITLENVMSLYEQY